MTPFFQAIFSAFHATKRQCPECGTEQSVRGNRRDPVVCVKCGATIPPATVDDRPRYMRTGRLKR